MKTMRMGGAAILGLMLVGVSGSFTTATAAPSVNADAVPLDPSIMKLLQDADKAIIAGNLSLALIQLKNAVRLAPQNGEVRARLGNALLKNREVVAAERELRQARNDNASDELVVPALLQAMIFRNELKELLAEFPDPPQGTQDKAAPDIFRARAIALQSLGQPAQAKIAIDRSLALRRDAASLFTGAKLAWQQNNLAVARSLTDEAIKLEPNSEEGLVIAVALMRESRESPRALAAVDEFVKRVPQSVLAKVIRVELLIEARSDAQAKQEVDSILRQAPRSLHGNYYRAVLLARANDFRSAWQVAQNLPPEFVQSTPPIAIMVARIAASSGSIESAGGILTTLLARRPEAPEAYEARVQLAALRLSQKAPLAALDTLASLKSSREPVVQALFAQAYLQLRRFDEAISSLEIVNASGTANDLLKRQLMLSHLQTGNVEAALAGLRELSERNPGSAETAAPLIVALNQMGNASEALAVTDRLAKNMTTASPLPDFYRGQTLAAQGNFSGASMAFGQALRIDPKFIPALYFRADVAIANGNLEEANRDLQQIIAQDPKNVFAYIRLAQIASNNDQEAQAVAVLERGIKTVPSDPTLRLALANYQIAHTKYPEAQATVTALLKVSPNNPEALAQQAQIQILRGETADAVNTFRTIAAQNAQSVPAQILLAEALIRTKDYLAARDAARKAVQLAPDSPQARAVQIAAEIADSKPEIALATARAFGSDHPGPQADLLLAETFLRLNRKNESVSVLEKSLASTPSKSAILRLSGIARASGEFKKAQALLASWLAKNSNDYEVRREYGSLLLELRELPAARREFEALVKQNAADPVALNNLGWLLEKDDPERALSLVTRAQRIAPRSAEISDTLGWMKYQRQDFEGALPLLQRAHDLDTENAWIAYHLAVVLDATGKRTQAKTLLQTALAKDPKFDDLENAKRLLARW